MLFHHSSWSTGTRETGGRRMRAASMGDSLPSPDNHLSMDFPHTFYGHYEDIGPKDRMEDAPMLHEFQDHSGGIFGVFDGHGGPGAANFARDNIYKFIINGLEKEEDRVDAFIDGYKRTEEALSQYLKEDEFPVLKAKYDIDDNYEELDKDYPVLSSGTTACVCMLDASRKPATLTVANLGDCKAVLNRGGKAICLTNCHNLKDPLPEERERVMPYFNNGVLGDYLFGIAVTRSLGDLVVATGEKNEGLLSIPEVVEVDVEPVDRFLIIASDGIFEVMDPQTAVETVRLHLLGRRSTPGSAAYTLVKQALARGTVDNVCAIVVMLHDYRFGLKALLTGGIKNEHLHGT
ncbi:protein phosphatase 2C, putative, partial [Perkinsus marinus ATCC 50983]